MQEDPGPGPHRALIGLVAFAAAIACVLFVMYQLHQAGRLQDCFASGRTNCAPIEAPPR
jgi:hypothetical protein